MADRTAALTAHLATAGKAVRVFFYSDLEPTSVDYFSAIKTFVHVTELGSLTRAAQALSIKTSTASRHLKDLEADLHIALFNRSTRGLSMTEGGKVFHARATALLEQLSDARDAAMALNKTPSGQLRVTIPGAFGRKYVTPYLPEFLARYPEIDVDIVFSDATLNLIESHIDLGIRIGALADSSLMARRLAGQTRVVCATPAYFQAHSVPATPEAMHAHRCLSYARAPGNTVYARRIAEPASAWQKIVLSGRLTLNDNDALLGAALAGNDLAVLPGWLVHDALASGKLQAVLTDWQIDYAREPVSVWAVYPPKKTVSSKVRALIDFLVEKYGDQPGWDAPDGF